jgi:GntR family transcriptional regulator/MocR family aminotransferase
MLFTPDAHVPLGAVMSDSRRAAAADWAGRTGGYLIGLRSSLAPRPEVVPPVSLLTLPAANTVLVGEVCDQLGPELRIGYAVVPVEVAARMRPLLRDSDATPPYISQRVATRLLRDGTLRRLSHRMRTLHDRQRRLVAAALADPGLRLGDPTAAGATPLYLPAGVDAIEVAAFARARGVRIRTLASYHWSGPGPSGALVVGYGHLRMEQLRRGLAGLAAAIAQVGPGGPMTTVVR